MHIRNVEIAKDYELVSSWWRAANEPGPTVTMMPEESTFIIEDLKGTPIAAITVYLLNTSRFAQLENLIAAPNLTLSTRREAVQNLVSYAENYIRSLGYQGVACMSYRPKLTERYQQLGYTRTLEQVTTLFKELK